MKYVLITGACGGMGQAAVKAFIQRGFGVFALDRVKCDMAAGVIPIEADITDESAVMRAVEQVHETTDELCGIIHYAGIYMLDSLVEMDTADFDRIFMVNLRGAFIVNKAFLPMLRQGSRIIITTSELASLDPLPFTGIYAVSKGALDKYAYSLRMELQLLGISVSVLRAGAVRTDMLTTSTTALERFCARTSLYTCNAKRFRQIVDRVEARCITPDKLAEKSYRIFSAGRPHFAYSLNRNPLLVMLDCLPQRLRFWIIARVLK